MSRKYYLFIVLALLVASVVTAAYFQVSQNNTVAIINDRFLDFNINKNQILISQKDGVLVQLLENDAQKINARVRNNECVFKIGCDRHTIYDVNNPTVLEVNSKSYSTTTCATASTLNRSYVENLRLCATSDQNVFLLNQFISYLGPGRDASPVYWRIGN